MTIPHIERTLNIDSVAPEKLEWVHTQVHVLWNRLLAGDYIEGWTFDDCVRIHSAIVQKKSEIGQLHHSSIDTLDAQGTIEASKVGGQARTIISGKDADSPQAPEPDYVHPLRGMISKEDDIRQLSDEGLLKRHAILHDAWAHLEKGNAFWGREDAGEYRWNKEDVFNDHALVLQELKNRGMHHRVIDDLDRETLGMPLSSERGSRIYLDEVMQYFRQQPPAKLKDPFVYLVGGLCENGFSDSDIDILIKKKEDPAKDIPLKFRIAQFLSPELQERIHWLFDPEFYGPFTNTVPLFSQALMPMPELKLRKMSKSSFSGEKIIVDVLGSDEDGGIHKYDIGVPISELDFETLNPSFTDMVGSKPYLILGSVVSREIEADAGDKLELEVRSLQQVNSKEGIYFSLKPKVLGVAKKSKDTVSLDELGDIAAKEKSDNTELRYKLRCVVKSGNLYEKWFDAEDISLSEAILDGSDFLGITGDENTAKLGTSWTEIDSDSDAIEFFVNTETRIVLCRESLTSSISGFDLPFVSEIPREDGGWFIATMPWLTLNIGETLTTNPFKENPLLQFVLYNRATAQQSMLSQLDPIGVNNSQTAPIHHYFDRLVDELGVYRQNFGKTIVPLISDAAKKQADESRKLDEIEPFRFFLPVKGIAGYRKNEAYSIEGVVSFTKPNDYPYEVDQKFDGFRIILSKVKDKVTIVTEEGTDRTARFPSFVKEALEHENDFIVDAEIIGFDEDGNPIGRSDVSGYANSKGDADDSLYVAKIFDLVWMNDKDIHNESQKFRRDILEEAFPSGAKLEVIPVKWVKDSSELEEAILFFADTKKNPGSEGAMIKAHNAVYSLGGNTSRWIKYKNEVDLDVEVWKISSPRGSSSTFNYLCVIRDEKGNMVPVGKTFNTSIKAKKGDIIRVSFGNLNKWLDKNSDKVWYSWVFPRVLELREDKKKPDEVFTAERIVKETGSEVGEKPWPSNFKALLTLRSSPDEVIPVLKEIGCPICAGSVDVDYEIISEHSWKGIGECLKCNIEFDHYHWEPGFVLTTSSNLGKANLNNSVIAAPIAINFAKAFGCPKCYSVEPDKLEFNPLDGTLDWECGCGFEIHQKFVSLKSATLLPFVKPMKPFKDLKSDKPLTNEAFTFDDLKDVDFENYVAEPKYNGIRIQIHKKNSTIQVMTAYGNIIPNKKLGGLIPHLRRLKAKSGIWDAELFYKSLKETHFSKVYSLARTDNPSDDLDPRELKVAVFDIMRLNNRNLTGWTFEKRREKVLETVPKGSRVRWVVSQRIRDLRDAEQAVGSMMMAEGTVFKHRDSTYCCDEEKRWFKLVFMHNFKMPDIGIGEYSDEDLKQLHIWLHRFYRKFKEGKKVPGWTLKDVRAKHLEVSEEYKNRSFKHRKYDGLDRGSDGEKGEPGEEESMQLSAKLFAKGDDVLYGPFPFGASEFWHEAIVLDVIKRDDKTFYLIKDLNDDKELEVEASQLMDPSEVLSKHSPGDLVIRKGDSDSSIERIGMNLDIRDDKSLVLWADGSRSVHPVSELDRAETAHPGEHLGSAKELIDGFLEKLPKDERRLSSLQSDPVITFVDNDYMVPLYDDSEGSAIGNNPSTMVEFNGFRLLIDANETCDLAGLDPDALLFTSDSGFKVGDIPVFSEKSENLSLDGSTEIGPFIVEAFRSFHSLKDSNIVLRITAGDKKIGFAFNLLNLKEKSKFFSGLDLYIGDGSSFDKPSVLRFGDDVFGHTDIRTQLKWCAEFGVGSVYFTGDDDTHALIQSEYDTLRDISINESGVPQ